MQNKTTITLYSLQNKVGDSWWRPIFRHNQTSNPWF